LAAPSPSLPAVVIDTSIWISRIINQDSNHAAADSWVNRQLLNGGIFLAPTLLVPETAAVSRLTGQPSLAHLAMRELYSMPEMRLAPVDQGLIDEAADLAADLGLRGADAVFVALARLLGIPLVTFDNEQLSRPTSVIATIRP
jgi:predicted nucleic acid-binding protein